MDDCLRQCRAFHYSFLLLGVAIFLFTFAATKSGAYRLAKEELDVARKWVFPQAELPPITLPSSRGWVDRPLTDTQAPRSLDEYYRAISMGAASGVDKDTLNRIRTRITFDFHGTVQGWQWLPRLQAYWDEVSFRTPDDAYAYLVDKSKAPAFSFGPVNVSGEMAVLAGPICVLVVGAMLWVHLRNAISRLNSDTLDPQFPWFVLFKHVPYGFIRFTMVIPAALANGFLISRCFLDGVGWSWLLPALLVCTAALRVSYLADHDIMEIRREALGQQ